MFPALSRTVIFFFFCAADIAQSHQLTTIAGGFFKLLLYFVTIAKIVLVILCLWNREGKSGVFACIEGRSAIRCSLY